MDRGVKIVLASCLLLAGVGTAMLFRHPSPRARTPVAGSEELLVLRQPSAPHGAETVPARRPPPQLGSSEVSPNPPLSSSPPPRGLPSANREEPPPRLARDYPHLYGRPAPAVPFGMDRAREVRTHKIIDGDTLRGLADRYLGDAGRSWEIFEANRNVLASPEVLPIGVELKIPPRQKPIPPSPALAPERQLVPVPPAPVRRYDIPS